MPWTPSDSSSSSWRHASGSFASSGIAAPTQKEALAILANGKVVAPVDVLVKMDTLAPKDLEDWRFGRTPYLERGRGAATLRAVAGVP